MRLFGSVWIGAIVALIAMVMGGWLFPEWVMFLMSIALAKGLVAMGLVGLMRGGLVSFGQGLYFCLGAYAAGFASSWLNITDIFLLSLVGIALSATMGIIFGPLLASYRGIFFAMLSLSLSMILYGVLSKMSFIGGTDGINISSPTFFGYEPEGRELGLSIYLYTCLVTVVAGSLMRIFFDSHRGLISLAIRDNELRVEYLGASVRSVISINYVFAAILGGLGGVIAGLAIGHVDPEYAYWTTSGEFVFVAILAGHLSIPAVIFSSIVLEVVRSFSNLYFPNTWQLSLGIFLLIVILLLPKGLGSLKLFTKKSERVKANDVEEKS
ncbi:MAG: branched-chain amino acid ABC transporter permease [Sneathiella sp.]|uniref:branched-chain amino acid ABC transporter permease n=1 Tax=Sneathiella sp. TaxID=1964365 RepID=UPI0030024568